MFPEILRITDLQFDRMENYRKASLYRQTETPNQPEIVEGVGTVLPERAEKVSEEPLPMLKGSSDDEEEDDGLGEYGVFLTSAGCGRAGVGERGRDGNWRW
jgi:hypothetical protein